MSTLNFKKNINMSTSKKQLTFTMGADPEFCVRNGVSVVHANKTVEEGTDLFGRDGNGTTFEVRPEPSTCPIEVVNNIRNIFTRQCLINPKFLSWDWFAGSFQSEYPLGGHIHFGIKDNIISRDNATSILSQYVGALSVLVENLEQGRRRRVEKGYGKYEDNRAQNWGFEYRSMGSWITSPHVALAFLCLAKVVMHEVLNNEKFRVPSRIKPVHFSEMQVDKIREFAPIIWDEIRAMELFPQYQQQIDLLYYLTMKRVNGRSLSWFPSCSMKEAWGVADATKFNMSKLRIEAIWNKFGKKNEMVARF